MSCSRWEADLALYAGGDLPAGRIARVEAHLEACGACRSLVEETCASRAMLTELRAEPIEDVMAAAVRRRVLARVAAPEAAPARRYWKWALAAALILAAFVGFPRRAPQTPVPALHRVRQGAVVEVRGPAGRSGTPSLPSAVRIAGSRWASISSPCSTPNDWLKISLLRRLVIQSRSLDHSVTAGRMLRAER